VTALTPQLADEAIRLIEQIAAAQPGTCHPDFQAACDGNWTVAVTCAHGQFEGESADQRDPSRAFASAAENFRRAHTPLK
jgi:hypothetical protein